MKAIQLLKELHRSRNKQKYPNIPDHCRPQSKFSDKTANQLTNCILKWLELHNCWATRINTTGRYLQGEQYVDVLGHKKQLPGKWIPGTTRHGTADIHAVIASRHVSIEIKIGRDRMSDAQHKTREAIEQSGGVFWVVTSFDQFMEQYRTLTQVDKTK